MALSRRHRRLLIWMLCLGAAALLTACQPAALTALAPTQAGSASAGSVSSSAWLESASPQTLASSGQVTYASLEFREEPPIPRLPPGTHPFEDELLVLINTERENTGAAPLSVSHTLAALAREHSLAMGQHRFFSHNGLEGQTFEDRLKQAGYPYSAAAENIYAGNGPFNSPEAALKAWMNSPAHRANLLNPIYTEVGIGYRYVPDSPYGGYFTADFGTR